MSERKIIKLYNMDSKNLAPLEKLLLDYNKNKYKLIIKACNKIKELKKESPGKCFSELIGLTLHDMPEGKYSKNNH